METYSFGKEFVFKEWEMVEHYAYYDQPLIYLMRHVPSGHHYLGLVFDSKTTMVEGTENRQESHYTDLHALLDAEALEAIRTSTKTFREILIEAVEREVFVVHQVVRADETLFSIERFDKERLMNEILYKKEFYNMTQDE